MMISSFKCIVGLWMVGAVTHLVSAQDEVCITGYIMDRWCITNGVLMDDPTVVSLKNPEKHSVSCLIEVPTCVASGYEVLSDPQGGSDMYCRSFHLDESGANQSIAFAKEVGSCGICNGTQAKGLQATITGTIVESTNSSEPPMLMVSRVLDSSTSCSSLENVTPVTDFPCIAPMSQNMSAPSMPDMPSSTTTMAPAKSPTKASSAIAVSADHVLTSLAVIGWGYIVTMSL